MLKFLSVSEEIKGEGKIMPLIGYNLGLSVNPCEQLLPTATAFSRIRSQKRILRDSGPDL